MSDATRQPPGATPGDPGRGASAASRARARTDHVGKLELERRLSVIEQMLVQRVPETKIRQAVMHDPELGWRLSRSQANRLIAKVKQRWADESAATPREVTREHLRRSFEETFQRAYEARQYGAAITALRALGELDGILGKLQVQVDERHLHQHVHMNAGRPAPTVAELIADLDSMSDDEVRVIREVTRRALAPGRPADAR